MIEVFRVTIPLPPMARAEPKTVYMPGKNGSKGFVKHYTPPDRVRHQNAVKTLLKSSWRTWRASHRGLKLPNLIDFPVLLTGKYYLKTPQNLLTKPKLPLLNAGIWHGSKPDWTNYQKLYEDCLEGTVLYNDSLIVGPGMGSLKFFAVPPEKPRTELILWKI